MYQVYDYNIIIVCKGRLLYNVMHMGNHNKAVHMNKIIQTDEAESVQIAHPLNFGVPPPDSSPPQPPASPTDNPPLPVISCNPSQPFLACLQKMMKKSVMHTQYRGSC